MVALLSSVLEHGGLENRHAHCPENAGFRLSGVDEFGVDVAIYFFHGSYLPHGSKL
jgi:hypothetical protein